MSGKICKKCNLNKAADLFHGRTCFICFNLDRKLKRKNKINVCKKCKVKNITGRICLVCQKLSKHQYYLKNKQKVIDNSKKYAQNNPEKIIKYRKKYKIKNRDRLLQSGKKYYYKNIENYKKYREENKNKLKVKINNYKKYRRKTDVSFRLRENFSTVIRAMLKRNYGTKKGSSFTKYIPYTITQLKDHLEQQFEPWMTWNNWGIYNLSVWNDQDQSTWKWQIDHIIPQSTLPYTSMEDDNFKKCWDLDNLRPLSAKENYIKGNRIRESK